MGAQRAHDKRNALQRAVARLYTRTRASILPCTLRPDRIARAAINRARPETYSPQSCPAPCAPVASAQVNDRSTAAPPRGATRTTMRTGFRPGGSRMSPSTCWKYLNE